MNSDTAEAQEVLHILAVDDDQRLLDLLCRFLREEGFAVTTAASAAEARAKLEGMTFDAIVLDIMMPGETGLEFTSWLRQHHAIPILLLSAKGATEDRIEGLELGADDYLPKPFEPRELVARLKSILRRAPQEPAAEQLPAVVTFGPFSFDQDRMELKRDEDIIRMPPIEHHLLMSLIKAQGEAVDREDLAASAPIPSTPRSIDVQIGRLRRKIENDPRQPHYIHTVRGRGYRFTIPR